ncbi:MAG: flagellar motor switch protein FliM [Gammaproteobacteria bacterium]|nr:flagellar motor switch protein FliM [Gammaproteobacteria bacterium]MBU1553341.1 flagellar motor switch protein FliM [Gammaproteobacteria bacterium]MBU2070785.1 flagellar motor switch protein FliM [Gammaproteobacteria bacterium]MBU2182776.1 flagellar motor switch protein FliM [Gammaproteobacteria bacterium]MBU2205982.1 flagellar motor switch protein FliM [Gammaproteobacteria bacterium]
MKKSSLLIPAQQAADLAKVALTAEQRRFNAASQNARPLLADLARQMEAELGRLLTDIDFSIELNVCQGSALDSYLAEPGRILLQCPVLVPADDHCYLALDYTSIHHLADLALGGQLSKVVNTQSKAELSQSEMRICNRVAQRQIQAVQQLLFRQHSVLPVSIVQQPPAALQCIALKVRLLLEQDAISWFLWLPLAFFSAPVTNSYGGPALDLSLWPQIPVQCRVEMARKKVSLRQLRDCIAGKILPIELNGAMSWQLNHTTLFLGKVAEDDNGLVFQITDTVKREKQA